MADILKREGIYLWYYFSVQFEMIFPSLLWGLFLGSLISVFGKERIHGIFTALSERKLGALGLLPASLLGIASPLCLHGTVPLAASFSDKGMRENWLAAFIMSSVLLNPQLIVYSAALGPAA